VKSLSSLVEHKRLSLLIVLGGLQFLLISGIGSCAALAPDENNYVQIFENIYVKNQALVKIPGFSQTWIYYLFYFPAKILSILGINSLSALRISSIVLNLISINIILGITCRLKIEIKKEFFLILLFFLVPSYFIFTSLALRESIIIFNLSIFFLGVKNTFDRHQKTGVILITIGLICMAGIKFYLSVLLLLVLLGIELISWKRNKINFFLIFTFLIYALLNSSQLSQVTTYLAAPSVAAPSVAAPSVAAPSVAAPSVAAPSVAATLTSTTISELNSCFLNNQFGFLGFFASKFFKNEIQIYKQYEVSSGDNLADYKHNAVAATDFFAFQEGRGIRNFNDIPVGVANLLFGPLIKSESKPAKLFSLEIVFWVFFLAAFFVSLATRLLARTPINILEISASLFIIIFCFFSALTEVNMGTLVRHRIILIIPLFLYFFNSADGLWPSFQRVLKRKAR